MIRKIIKIDEDKCTGCTLCVDACHEGAIGMFNGKAVLLRDDYCDGLGDCLPACPVNAISFEEREALAYDEAAVLANIEKSKIQINEKPKFQCPSTISKTSPVDSPLKNWPVQIKLVAPTASFFNGANLLIAADCCGFAYDNFNKEFVHGNVTLIGCPKLDNEDYTKKLKNIIENNNIESITVTKMEVPCCMGLELSVINALNSSSKDISLRRVTISRDGRLL